VAQTRPAKAGHGRYETRTLWAIASPDLNAYAGSSGTYGEAWPGLAQVCRIQRLVRRRSRKTGAWTEHAEVAYAVTSLPPAWATAGQLLRRWRGHWRIENGLHWVRDVTFGEDKSPIHRGQAPELFALLRNSAIALLAVLAQPSVPAALREVTTSLAAFHKPFDRLAALLNPPTIPVPPRPP
jgi:predicted transposase YbfD/YdcC